MLLSGLLDSLCQWDKATPTKMTEIMDIMAGSQPSFPKQQLTAAKEGSKLQDETGSISSFKGQKATLKCKERCRFHFGIVLIDVYFKL